MVEISIDLLDLLNFNTHGSTEPFIPDLELQMILIDIFKVNSGFKFPLNTYFALCTVPDPKAVVLSQNGIDLQIALT